MGNERGVDSMLGDLKDPSAYQAPLEISGRDPGLLVDLLRTMMVSRMVVVVVMIAIVMVAEVCVVQDWGRCVILW